MNKEYLTLLTLRLGLLPRSPSARILWLRSAGILSEDESWVDSRIYTWLGHRQEYDRIIHMSRVSILTMELLELYFNEQYTV